MHSHSSFGRSFGLKTARRSVVGSILLFLTCSVLTFAAETEGVSREDVIQHYGKLVSAVYDDTLAAAEALQTRVNDFLEHPSEEGLKAAREAWIAARKPYLQSEAFRFCEGPVDLIEGRINAWPVDENYLDYVEGAQGGIINDTTHFPKITMDLMLSLNEKEGEKNICLGYHAIEFLLWGQDQSTTGPGNRPFRDYVVGSDAPNPERRREVLRMITDKLVTDLRALSKAWAPGDATNYRAWFIASLPNQSLGKMLHGMGSLGGVELAGERLTVPYDTKEQEDEHSCFSDTTHLDALYDTIGIQNVYYGRYVRTDGTRIEGPCLNDLLSKADPDLAKEVASRVDAAVEAACAIPAPFDQAILGKDTDPGRKAIFHLIQSLQAQSDPIARAKKLLGTRKSE